MDCLFQILKTSKLNFASVVEMQTLFKKKFFYNSLFSFSFYIIRFL